MQVVIDIPEEEYKRLVYIDMFKLRGYIENGTPLPKGHGRLIDETDLKTLFGLDDRLWWGNAVERFIDLPTIIEADKGRK